MAVSALHFYESKGLITSVRNSGNQRRYKRDVLRYVAIIRIAQRIGIPLATIGEAFGVLPEGHTLSAKEWKQLSSQWREELDRRIHTLVALRDELDGCIGCGCLRAVIARCVTRATAKLAHACWKMNKTKAPQGRFSLFPVFVFLSIPLVHKEGFPRRQHTSFEHVVEVPVGVDALIVCHRRFFASVKVYFLAAIFLSSQTIFYRNPERCTTR